MSAAWTNAASSSWDFSSGRGEGATRADRWAVRQRRASQVLAGTLARDDDFWRYAEAIADSEENAEKIAANYVPRESPQREAIRRLLLIASENIGHRFDRKGRAGRGILRVTTAAGPIAYFPDDSTAKANAFSEPGIRILDEGAVFVARRGALRCLECGERLPDARRPTHRGQRAWTERAHYCDGCLGSTIGRQLQRSSHPSILSWHFDAIRKVLEDAAPQILAAREPGNAALGSSYV